MSQQPCLPLVSTKRKRQENNNTIAFDNVEAMNASEYLQRVVQEARTIPDETLIAPSSSSSSVRVRSSLDEVVIDGSAASMQYLLSRQTQIAPPPRSSIQRQSHEAAWITQALHQFVLLRNYLVQCQEQGVGGKDHRLLSAVPPMKDRAGWMEFCTGLTDRNDDDTDDKDQSTIIVAAWKEALPPEGYHSPSVQLLCQLDQVMIRRVLEHLATFPHTGTQQLYLWLYALMAKLETPVHGQDAATLRKLVVTVAARRAEDGANPTTIVAAMNLVLVVAGLYFGQASYQELFPSRSRTYNVNHNDL